MWEPTEPMKAWHESIDMLVRHVAACKRCAQVEAYGRHPFNRCAEGRGLADAEQAAYRAWVSERYGGLAA